MSGTDGEPEIEGEHYVKVPMGEYNSLVDAADLGFEVMVQRRNDLKAIAGRIPLYPERDSAKMRPPADGLLDGVPLLKSDVEDLVRSYDGRIRRLAVALNAPIMNKRYR